MAMLAVIYMVADPSKIEGSNGNIQQNDIGQSIGKNINSLLSDSNHERIICLALEKSHPSHQHEDYFVSCLDNVITKAKDVNSVLKTLSTLATRDSNKQLPIPISVINLGERGGSDNFIALMNCNLKIRYDIGMTTPIMNYKFLLQIV
jgi:hypothetical protein